VLGRVGRVAAVVAHRRKWPRLLLMYHQQCGTLLPSTLQNFPARIFLTSTASAYKVPVTNKGGPWGTFFLWSLLEAAREEWLCSPAR
jgi:hypothetical protein